MAEQEMTFHTAGHFMHSNCKAANLRYHFDSKGSRV